MRRTKNESVDPRMVSERLERGKGSFGSGAFISASESSRSQLDTFGGEVDDISHVGKLSAVQQPYGRWEIESYLAHSRPAVLRRAS